ncbi:MAG: UMP kinase [Nanoarchaeota archaeon]|nr:UMP kinase [Nanoarchaeota archaeon]
MRKKVVVISLGGSLIIPEKINTEILERFKRVLLRHTIKYRFVVVCGGGKVARTYINGLNSNNRKKQYFQSLLGISVTRTNARFMTYFFGKDANQGMPHDMKDVENLLIKNEVVFCGALRYGKNETSDGAAAKLAHHFNTDFINLTNVKGLYEKDPKKFRSAEFIPDISHKDFCKMAKKIEYKPGQHFILDQKAAKIIKKYKITTYILGPELKNLDNLLNGKHFVGTIIG